MAVPEHDPGDLEQYAGEEIPDPWDDPAQTDWPMDPAGEADPPGHELPPADRQG